MAGNKKQTDRIHDQMPRYLKTRQNPNWGALIKALGESDQDLTDLIEEVRNQLFVKTANRPYLDRLGANFKVNRPRFVGMDDLTFRDYIPVLAYQPKQVKLILDALLDIFFFRESTTSFTQTEAFEPFTLKDGWQLEYTIDATKSEEITFRSSDFVDITNASAEEVAAVINRNAQDSFAVVFDDRIQKRKFIRIFTNTIGSKGSVLINGGRADIGLRFVGYNNDAGAGVSTIWTVTKVGETVTFQHTGGASPSIDKIQIGDAALIDIPGNEGSFVIADVDVGNSSFSFTNLFGTPGVYDHGLNPDYRVQFTALDTMVIYNKNNRAVVWEVEPGQIIVEMPASPPVVKRELAGSAHINGLVNTVLDRVSDTEMQLDDGSEWPLNGGMFVLQERNELRKHILTDLEDFVDIDELESRFDKQNIFQYTSRVGDNLTGITPNLPAESEVLEFDISTAVRDVSNLVTVTTTAPHGFVAGENVGVQNVESATGTPGIRVDVSIADTATDVANKAAIRINAETDFSAIAIGSTVEVTTAANGVTVDAVDIDSGLAVAVSQQGTAVLPEITQVIQAAASTFDVVGNALRWEISAGGDTERYHVWYNVTDGVNQQLNPGMDQLVNGSFIIIDTPSPTTFTYSSLGEPASGINGLARVERIGLAEQGSLAYLTTARIGTGIVGPNIWDLGASFVLSAQTSNTTEQIQAGNNVRTIQIETPNNIPNEEGSVVFGFGTEREEGPIRYLFKATPDTLQLDPAYVFQNNHPVGESVTVIRRKGAHVISTTGKEFAPYITDPAVARETLQELLRQTKSVGIFIEFLIRFPEQLYGTLDVYRSGNEALHPINVEQI